MPSQSINPRNGQAFGPALDDTTDAEVDAIVARAVEASGPWAALPVEVRAGALSAIADALDADADHLAEIADSETGLGLPRLMGEVARTTFQLRMFADAIRGGSHLGVVLDPLVAGEPPAGHPELRRMLLPIGPVAVFGASNFPFAFSVMGGDSASALAAGCTVVAKAHSSHPQTCGFVASIATKALAQAGAPEGTFAMVRGHDAGSSLVQHAGIAAGAFTGSTAGGRALFDLAVRRPTPIPFYGELGSVNPVVVSPLAAVRPGIAAEYVASLCLGAGQFCTNPSLILVPQGSGLAESIVAEVVRQQPGTMLNANVRRILAARVAELTTISGVRTMPPEVEPSAGLGFSVVPMVLVTDVQTALAERRLLTTECFGPVGVVVEYSDEGGLLALLAALEGCLVSTIHAEETEDMAVAVLPSLVRISGRIVWNAWPTGLAVTGAQQHGGPYPASTNALHTSVGTTAMRRFQRPVAFQSVPSSLLPPALR